ncbi:hypothetical protein LAZ40_11525 [Cereibacter sphaeroides]|uniref:hypothetical protein n=1 Tax=Cereibacter sphaeroides TaxID=1063 RepID=UPI001F21374D|nr:hypothetical protein [Cereibacter sphaeroides]MCE6959648.1 hypothetical protein [Cereibacter sphaeroides]MCE6974491.1 hypothetical protein [Cereibacter sphaeroides]
MVDLLQIIQNVVGLLPDFSVFLYILSWVMGCLFVATGIRNAAKRHQMGQSAGSWAAPFWTFVIGVMFVALPGLVASMTQTFFAQEQPDASSIFAYAPATIGLLESGSPGRTMIEGIVLIVQFVGLIAVMRGLFLLNQSAQGAGGPKTFGPGATFVIAGIMAVNFPLFVGAVELLITSGGTP